jgi:hypothetical protein
MRRRAAAEPTVAAGDVVDEVGHPCGTGRSRAGGEQVVQVGSAARVERVGSTARKR